MVAGIGGVFGAAADFLKDYAKHARVKYVPKQVEVERVGYYNCPHIPRCVICCTSQKTVVKTKEWRMVKVVEYDGSGREGMDYLRENPSAKTRGDAKVPGKLNLQFFAEGADIKAKKHAVGSVLSEKTITNSAGQEVTRKYVKDQDALLRMTEEAAGGFRQI